MYFDRMAWLPTGLTHMITAKINTTQIIKRMVKNGFLMVIQLLRKWSHYL